MDWLLIATLALSAVSALGVVAILAFRGHDDSAALLAARLEGLSRELERVERSLRGDLVVGREEAGDRCRLPGKAETRRERLHRPGETGKGVDETAFKRIEWGVREFSSTVGASLPCHPDLTKTLARKMENHDWIEEDTDLRRCPCRHPFCPNESGFTGYRYGPLQLRNEGIPARRRRRDLRVRRERG